MSVERNKTALRKRLEEKLSGRCAELDDAAIEHLLRERAARLSTRALDVVAPKVFATVIVARRRDTLLGFPIERVREMRPVRLTRLPHRSPSISGIFQLRGQLHSLVDLTSLVGGDEPLAHGAEAFAAVLELGQRALGIRIDEVIGPRVVVEDELDRTYRERSSDLVDEVTRDCVEILDVAAIFESKDFNMGERT